MRFQYGIVLFTLLRIVIGFSDQLYDKFIHYARYSALSACITHGNLSEGWLHKGACHLNFCHSDERNMGAQIVKVNRNLLRISQAWNTNRNIDQKCNE